MRKGLLTPTFGNTISVGSGVRGILGRELNATVYSLALQEKNK